MERFEFYKNSYFKGLERKHKLNKSLNIPIGVAAFLGSIIYYYITSFFDFIAGWPKWVFIGLIAFSVLGLFGALYHIISSYYNFGYRYIPTNSDWEEYYDSLEEYYENKNINSSQADNDLREALIDELVKSHEFNYNNNNIKSYHLHKANGFIIGTIVLVLLAAGPYFLNYSKNGNKNSKNNIHYIMPEEEQQDQRPDPPEGEIIKEGEKPSNKKSSDKEDDE